jgi:sortase A
MSKMIPALSKGMLIIGALLILAGLGWGIWMRVNQPPKPEFTEEGAVVMAVTARVLPQLATITPTASPTPTEPPSPTPTQPPRIEDPTPSLLPDWTVTATPPEPTPRPPTSTPTPTPTPTPPPPAENPPTRIVAPSIGLDASVKQMAWDKDGTMISEWIVPENAAGWHINSAVPGNNENVVLSGHHNIKGKVFRYVIDLEPGDQITIYADDNPYVYYVAEKYLLQEHRMPTYIRKKNAQWIMPTGDERLTLVTCWPYEWPGNSHRVIVVARPLSYFEDLRQEAEGKGAE